MILPINSRGLETSHCSRDEVSAMPWIAALWRCLGRREATRLCTATLFEWMPMMLDGWTLSAMRPVPEMSFDGNPQMITGV